MAKQRISIVGGGLAGLSAAFELTRTAELRERYEVTLYQMGWRLGGKCASGRDEFGRNVEHGLHIWFGYYENAFRLLRDVYQEWDPPEGQKIKSAEEAVRPQTFTPIGALEDGEPYFHRVSFPTNDELPGFGTANLSVWNSLVRIIQLFTSSYERALQSDEHLARREPQIRATIGQHSLLAALNKDPAQTASSESALRVGQYLRAVTEWSKHIDGDRVWSHFEEVQGIADALRESASALVGTSFAQTGTGNVLAQTLDVASALANGLITDLLLGERSIADLDRLDFRQWLLMHGAKEDSVHDSPALFALYDTMFQYPDGERGRASYGAGTAVQVVLRMLGTYQGALAWELQAGMGDVLVAPLFQVLKSRAVRFRFFHKLRNIDIDSDMTSIVRLHFDRQVNLRIDQDDYEPVRLCEGVLSWSAAPDWSVIEDGEMLKDAGVDLESHWCDQSVSSIAIQQGCDFDEAVLAIPLGAFKKLNPLAGPCCQLLKANERFRTMTERLPLVPSISVQVWSERALAELGWTAPKPAMVCAPQPLAVWGDMSQVLAYEPPTQAKSLHYFCDVLATQLYRRPPTDASVPEQGKRLATSLATRWFEKAMSVWPHAVLERGEFDWGVLFSPSNEKGQERLGSQVVRANVNPSDCCVASAAGTTAFRLRANESGFSHLFLCGSWINSGLNTECIEAAIMSGMQAARAISQDAVPVPGESFLHLEQESISPCDFIRAATLGMLSLRAL
ncbi:NAD(P)-binding protein [Bradyrhizobium sp. BRP19]|uniref:NAD(P)-binding protein n=1 Tax=Bradyrhizobium sp. BRP19 TaxID=2793823 RepID=UPI001CD2DDF7|nr:NAD(P)-binding protein [Bradyrhizobium sp. BRP19]MCA1549974.1 NAD(P)-binding protein [Bradyrhizobium sp. BRP19]